MYTRAYSNNVLFPQKCQRTALKTELLIDGWNGKCFQFVNVSQVRFQCRVCTEEASKPKINRTLKP